MKSLLELTDGNLASHARSLEDLGYIHCEKRFLGRKPNTSYSITDLGRAAFSANIQALASFVNSQQ
jgi:DNA-binding PadR family transcriptional regulator